MCARNDDCSVERETNFEAGSPFVSCAAAFLKFHAGACYSLNCISK